jgi:hypothetical protein
MWHAVASGVPSALVVILATFCQQQGAPSEHSSRNRVVGAGGVSVDCSCPTVIPVTCDQERLSLESAIVSLNFWRTVAFTFFVISCLFSLVVWITSPYTFAGYWLSEQPVNSSKASAAGEKEISREVAESVGSTSLTVQGKGGPVTPGSLAAWKRSQGV